MTYSETRIEAINKDRLREGLDPVLKSRVERLIALAKEQGFSLVVTQGFRSVAQQNALYAQGRSRPGKIVTNAKGGQSKHNYGRAVDLAFVVNGEVVWDEALYRKIGAWAREVGLKWGGDWKRFKDKPHVEV